MVYCTDNLEIEVLQKQVLLIPNNSIALKEEILLAIDVRACNVTSGNVLGT